MTKNSFSLSKIKLLDKSFLRYEYNTNDMIKSMFFFKKTLNMGKYPYKIAIKRQKRLSSRFLFKGSAFFRAQVLAE